MVIELEPHAEGWIVPVRALAGAKRNELRGVQDGALRIAVTQVAEKGKANVAIRDHLAKALGMRKSQVALVSGATSPHKKFLFRQVDRDQLLARIAACNE